MKVNGTEGVFQIPDSEKSQKRSENPDGGFQEIFQKTLKPDQPQAVAPSMTTFVRPCVPLMETDLRVNNKADVADRVEHLLDMLEDYRRHLSQPGSGMKTLDAVVRKLDGQRQALAPVLDELPDGDGLKTILNESLVTASVEIFKFNRGDYLAS